MTVGDRDLGSKPPSEGPRTVPAGAGESSGAGQPAGEARPARRPWWIWAVPFAAIFGVLLVRNRFLFSTRLYEGGDSGANSILIEQAKRFTLLVGNYSRVGFHHPGPAYMYAQAIGEWLAHDRLHVVPTAWNGQLLAIFALNSAFAAIAVGIVYGWTRSLRGAAACFLVVLAFMAVHPAFINSGWMPYMYVPTFFLFALAAASVAARRTDDLWALALSGWFLIHGQASFLFFVPVITFAVLVAVCWPHRRTPWASVRRFFRDYPGAWISALVISAVFVFPIAVNLALHWPGDFGKYFAYGNSSGAGGHGASQIVPYALWFWWPHQHAWVVPLVLYPVALVTTITLARDPLRRFLLSVLGINVVVSVAFLFFAAVGIDVLSDYYIGFFYWSVPFLTLMVIAVGVVQAVRLTVLTPVLVAGSAVAVAAVALVPGLRTSTHDNIPALPTAVATLAARHPGQPIVIHIDQASWVAATGFLVQAERTHVRACIEQASWTFMMTRQFICSPGDTAHGARYRFVSTPPRPGTPAILYLGITAVIPAA
jgi:hypothetical protein